MLKFLNKRFPTDSFPELIVHIYYFMSSAAFCYIYYHKFVEKGDFYTHLSSAGIYPVLEGTAVKPMQFRLLIPYVFKLLKVFIGLFHTISDRNLFFLMIIFMCYFILVAFYFLLNEYFRSRAVNAWLAVVIIYPMIWNFVILNGQFFYMDFSVLLIIILGYYFIVSEQPKLLFLVFVIGLFNHPSVGYLIPAYLFFNYRKLLRKETIIYTLIMAVVYVATYKILDRVYPSDEGYFVLYNLPRNLSLFHDLPLHIILRDFVLVFGGLHFLVLLLFITGIWKKYRGPMLYISLVIVPYVVSVFINFSIEEIRNYIAILPFVLMPALLLLASFDNSFLRVTDKVLAHQVTAES